MLGQAVAVQPSRVRYFYLAMSVAAAVVVFAGFAPSYYLKPVVHLTRYPGGAGISSALPLTIHLHAVTLTLWLVLLVTQSALIAAGRTAVHRRLGIAAAGLIPVITVLGVITAIRGGRDGWNPGGPFADSLGFMVVSFGDIALFTGFVVAGLCFRRQSAIHKRLMILGTLSGLMWPAITRIPYVAPNPLSMFGLLIALVLAMPVREYIADRRIHPVTLWGSLVILGSFPLRTAIGTSGPWHRLAAWLINT